MFCNIGCCLLFGLQSLEGAFPLFIYLFINRRAPYSMHFSLTDHGTFWKMESQATQQVPTYSFCHPLTGGIKHSHKWPPPPSAPQIPKTNRTVNPMCLGQWEVKTNGAHVPRPVQCSTPNSTKSSVKVFYSLLFPSLLFSSLSPPSQKGFFHATQLVWSHTPFWGTSFKCMFNIKKLQPRTTGLYNDLVGDVQVYDILVQKFRSW